MPVEQPFAGDADAGKKKVERASPNSANPAGRAVVL